MFVLLGSRGVVSGGLFHTAALWNGLTSSVRAAGKAKAELILGFPQNARKGVLAWAYNCPTPEWWMDDGWEGTLQS